MTVLKEMLSDGGGNLSMMRVVSSLIPLIIVVTWSITCIRHNELASFDVADVIALIGPLGAKAYQKGKEVGA